jgi:lysylphosphatidylglycerol synthetase-like protein (DUF2156 family)
MRVQRRPMDDLHSINEAINRRAGRKFLPSIAVSVTLIVLVWFTLAFQRQLFAVLIGIAVILGIREIVHAFNLTQAYISLPALVIATIILTAATWRGRILFADPSGGSATTWTRWLCSQRHGNDSRTHLSPISCRLSHSSGPSI